MNTRPHSYKRHRFPPDIIQYAVWLYYRFNLGRHLICAYHYRKLRHSAFASWKKAVAA
jgi:transposase-like protein